MVRRLFWVNLPLWLLTQVGFASENAWNCQQDKHSKEWVCVGEKKPAPTEDEIYFPKTQQSAVKKVPNISVEPVDIPKSVIPKVEPKPAIAAPVVSPKPEIAIPSVPAPVDNATAKTDSNGPQIENTRDATIPSEPIEAVAPSVAAPSEAAAEPKEPERIADDAPSATNNAVTDTKNVKRTELPGWHCGAGEDQANWDCKLVGADPKGKPQVVAAEVEDDFSFRLLDPVFDHSQEQIFRALNARFPVDPWGFCGVDVTPKIKKSQNTKDIRESSPLDMNSNYSEIFDNEIGSYSGEVEIRRADQRASAHSAHYDTVSETLNLQGDVFYSEDEIAIHTDSATLKLNSDEARLRDTVFISPTTPIRGKASAVYRDNQYLTRYRDVAYTTCRPGNQDWAVHATQLKLNKETGKGAAKNAWLEFKGMPVFYSPYLSFPMDDRRLTGFLAPVFGTTRSSGFDFSTPFYWNIAPNYDATLRPRYLSERGILLAGDFRYLTESSQGKFSAEFLPSDTKSTGTDIVKDAAGNDQTGKNINYQNSRYQVSFDNVTHFTPKISSNLDLNYVSDKNYFSELGNSLSFTNFRAIKSVADLKYRDDGIALTGQLVNYQVVDPAAASRRNVYRKLPQVNLALDHAFNNVMPVPIYTQLDSEFVYFQQDVNTVTKRIPLFTPDGQPVLRPNGAQATEPFVTAALPQGQRFNVKPSISLPWKNNWGYITPKASLQYSQYELSDQGNNPSSVSRVLPIMSVDSGLYFERNLDIVGAQMLHTLEPRLFYLYIPKTDQRDIPLFDTSLYDFNYNSLFRENRFSGSDRIQDANQITLALTSRLIDAKTGKEKFKLNLGNIVYFQDREVTLTYFDQDPRLEAASGRRETPEFLSQRFSNLVAEATGQLNDHFSMDTGLQWNPRTNHIERGNIDLHFVNNPGELLNLGFKFRRDESRDRSITLPSKCNDLALANTDPDCQLIQRQDIIMTDASFRWPFYDDWYGIGRWQYSWLYGRTQEAFLGFEKENCCWRFRIIGRRYFNGLTNLNSTTGTTFDLNTAQAQTGVFFQIELKGLTGIGQKLDDFFERNIYGYQKPQSR